MTSSQRHISKSLTRNHLSLVKISQAKEIQHWNHHLMLVAEQRDREAFRELFNHFAPLIKSFFMAKFSSNSAVNSVEELVQEVMIKVWQKASSFDPQKAAASTWIFTLARNTRIDMLRRQKRYANTSSLETEQIWEDTTQVGPFQLLHRQRQTLDVQASLRHLPSEQATVIRKVYLEGKSHSEISEELGIPLGTVKSRVRLAQAKLQSHLKLDI